MEMSVRVDVITPIHGSTSPPQASLEASWSGGVELNVRVDPITPISSHVNGSTSPQRSLESSSSSPQSSFNSTSLTCSPEPPPLEGHSVARVTKTQTWKSLKESIPHARYLKKLEREEKFLLGEVRSHKKAVQRLSKDLYQVVSIYAVVQGALFAAVAQTSVFTCEDRWGPVAIAVAITLGTFVAVVDKLRSMGQKKEKAEQFKARQRAVYEDIDTLRWEGAQFDLDSIGPQHNYVQDRTPGFRCVLSVYGLLALGFLVGFSALIITSCIQMMCPISRCNCAKKSM